MRLPITISASPTQGALCTPSITSTSFISGTGLKKWKPAKRCAVFSFAEMVVTDSDEVLVARMHSGVTTCSSSANTACLTARFSTIASTSRWQRE